MLHQLCSYFTLSIGREASTKQTYLKLEQKFVPPPSL